MKDPAFAAAFAESNPGLASFLVAAASGDPNAAKLANMDALLDAKMGDMLNNPELAAATLLALLDKMSPEELAALLTCISTGVTDAEAAGTGTANITDNLKTAILEQAMADKAKLTLILQMAVKPELVNVCNKAALMALDPDMVKAAMANILANNPGLLDAASIAEALAALGMSPDQMKDAMLNSLDSPEARKVMLEIMANNGFIDPAAAAD